MWGVAWWLSVTVPACLCTPSCAALATPEYTDPHRVLRAMGECKSMLGWPLRYVWLSYNDNIGILPLVPHSQVTVGESLSLLQFLTSGCGWRCVGRTPCIYTRLTVQSCRLIVLILLTIGFSTGLWTLEVTLLHLPCLLSVSLGSVQPWLLMCTPLASFSGSWSLRRFHLKAW